MQNIHILMYTFLQTIINTTVHRDHRNRDHSITF